MWKIIASGFGSGYVPVAPGTAGALVGVAILWGLQALLPGYFTGGWPHVQWLLLLCLVFYFLGVKAANAMEPAWGHDPSKVVVDEMVGVWVAMLAVPVTLLNLFVAFVLFRIFDIWKPLGIRKLEAVEGGHGVMLDDVLAGIYSLLIMHLLLILVL